MKKHLILILFMVLFFTSCGLRKNFAYLQDMLPGYSYPVTESKEMVIKSNDKLSITVTCKEPELVKMFNVRGAFSINSNGNLNLENSYNQRAKENGYKVDKHGNIDFPILGKLHLAGLTIPEAVELIENKIENDGHVVNPTVIMEILNFKYIVLGATGKGVFTADDGDVTLIEAIAKAGDISDLGRLNKIMVIRETDGKRRVYVHDIRSKDIFDSPCYYLQQNDIIYVEPKYRGRTRAERGMQVVSMILGFLTTISTAFVLVNSYKNK